TWLVAHAFSKRVVGMVGSPSRVAASGAMCSCRSVSPPVTLPKYSAWIADGATPASRMASDAASANSSALVRSCLPNLVTPTPITATRRIAVSFRYPHHTAPRQPDKGDLECSEGVVGCAAWRGPSGGSIRRDGRGGALRAGGGRGHRADVPGTGRRPGGRRARPLPRTTPGARPADAARAAAGDRGAAGPAAGRRPSPGPCGDAPAGGAA